MNFVLGEILKFSQKYSQVVILIMLGIIIIGSTGGSIFISNLNNRIDSLSEEKASLESLYKEKMDIADQRSKLRESQLKDYINNYTRRMQEIENTYSFYIDSLKNLTKKINSLIINNKSSNSREFSEILSLSKKLDEKIYWISREFDLIKTNKSKPDIILPNSIDENMKLYKFNTPLSYYFTPTVVISALILIYFLLKGYFLRKRKNKFEKYVYENILVTVNPKFKEALNIQINNLISLIDFKKDESIEKAKQFIDDLIIVYSIKN